MTSETAHLLEDGIRSSDKKAGGGAASLAICLLGFCTIAAGTIAYGSWPSTAVRGPAGVTYLPHWRTFVSYTNIGGGHCVDAGNRRPPHCYGWGQTQASCEAICSGISGCKGYEYGQNWGGILCQLVYPVWPGSCPSGFTANAVGEGGTAIAKTFHATGGSCYKKN